MRSNRVFGRKLVNSALKTAAALSIALLPLTGVLPAAAQGFSVVHTFSFGTNDGYGPFPGLTEDSSGNLYGTTQYGGRFDFGTVFELPTTGGEKVLYNFTVNL